MRTNTDFAKQISRYLSEYLPHERNVSPNTILSYRDTFVQYIEFMRDKKGIKVEKLRLEAFTKDNVVCFLNHLIDEKHCSINTRNQRLAVMKSFSTWLQYVEVGRMEQWQKIHSIPAMRNMERKLDYLTLGGIKLLLEQPDANTPKGQRHLAILSLMYETGMRVQELGRPDDRLRQTGCRAIYNPNCRQRSENPHCPSIQEHCGHTPQLYKKRAAYFGKCTHPTSFILQCQRRKTYKGWNYIYSENIFGFGKEEK